MRQSFGDHSKGGLFQFELCQVTFSNPLGGTGVATDFEPASMHTTEKIDQDIVVLGPAPLPWDDAIQNF